MSTIITRMYETYGDALSAVNDLKKNRIEDGDIELFSKAPNEEAVPSESAAADGGMVAAITKIGVPASDAQAFAALVSQNHSLVVVQAPMGIAKKATTILDRNSPMAGAVNRKEYYRSASEPGAPLSSMFGWPVLITDATPFSRFWNMPAISRATSSPLSSWLGIPTIWSGRVGDRGWFGMPKLISKDATFSSLYNLPFKTKSQSPLSEFLNMPQLSKTAAPFSEFFSIPSLVNEKGWNKTIFGWAKLTSSSASLSKVLGVPEIGKSGTIFPSDGVSSLSKKGTIAAMLGFGRKE